MPEASSYNKRFLVFFAPCISLCALLCVLMGANALAGFEKEFFEKDLPIEVNGDSVTYDRENEVYLATGNVVVVQGGSTLKADMVKVDIKNGVSEASGGVTVSGEHGDVIAGESVTINMADQSAIIVNGRLFYKEGNLTAIAKDIKKTGPATYEAEKVTLTTCDCKTGAGKPRTPDWSVRTERARLVVEDYVSAWNTFFYVKNVPILYTPFMAFSVSKKRESGFLTPDAGFSKLMGTKVDNSFFWAISDNMDATLYADLESKRGVGEGIEFRYYRTARSFGELFVYHFDEWDINRVREFRANENNFLRPKSATSKRGEVNFTHTEFMDRRLTFKTDLRLVTDDEYFIDFAGNRKGQHKESLESTASITKTWDAYNLTTEARSFNNLLLKHDDMVLQKAPAMTIIGTGRRVLSTPLFFSLNSSLVNFERQVGMEGQRGDLSPRISVPIKPGGLFELTPAFTPRLTAYTVQNDPNPFSDDTRYRVLYEGTTEVVSTFVRYFDLSNGSGKGVEKLRHTIRPRFLYTYIPTYDQSDLPFFDSYDRLFPRSSVRYSLNTALTGKFARTGAKHEYVYMDIGQIYDIRERRGHRVVDPAEDRPYELIDSELIVRPTTWSSLRGVGRYDVYDDWFKNYAGELSINHGRGHRLSLSHRFARDVLRYSEGSANLQLTRAVNIGYAHRYSHTEEQTLEEAYAVGVNAKCWAMNLTYRDQLEDEVVMLTFSLTGIGEVVSAKTGLDESGI